MQWWQALILGVVEGITEYLPVSSTGHLILTAWLMGFSTSPAQWQAAFTFNIVIQAGAIAAVLGLYRARIKQMVRGVRGHDVQGRRLVVHLLLAFFPAAVLGLLLNKTIERHLNGPWPVAVALFVGGVIMLAVGYNITLRRQASQGRELDDLDWRSALLIGGSQCFALWPGTSRSMVTIVVALLLGLRATAAAEFSFLLGVITLGAATAFKAVQGGSAMLRQFGMGPILLGVIAATVSAALAVAWLVGFLNRRGVTPFGWYRLVLAVLLAVLLWLQMLVLPVA
ncbi:MAG TPA: undecaprenyl-diphosphate phosphatase [Candidatus Tectomicrobia bacterium]|jgi:undecaprenyl-diphosphatase